MTATLNYVRDPEEIYRLSFERIGELDELRRLPPALREVAMRIVHACGMPEIIADLRYTPEAPSAGRAALARGAPILCDTESVRASIIARNLPPGTEPECAIGSPRIADHALRHGMTRAAAQIDLWADRLDGSIVVIGNAPTALFRLLENIDNSGPRPALLLAFPVGFVGAAEAKDELATSPRGLEYITLTGRRGGSAMAAAAVNAIASGLAS